MKLLHQLGHKHNWALDVYFQNNVGDGFIILAYSIAKDKIGSKLSGYSADKYLSLSFVDLQFYGSKNSKGGKLDSYEFHPINYSGNKSTEVSTLDAVEAGIKYQENLGLKKILIPNIYSRTDQRVGMVDLLKRINSKVKDKKVKREYFMTIPISGDMVRDDEAIEKLLQELTDMDISFDGYYIVCEPNLETRKKISVDFKYYVNLGKVLSTLKRQGFQVILGYSNVDSLVFSSLTKLDYVSIGTYENLRNFNIKRFTDANSGGPSDGWYYSEKLLNFVKAKQLEILHERGAIDLIRNEDNIFSDIILQKGYPWNTHRPDVQKNYLLAISRQLKALDKLDSNEERISWLARRIENAKETYRILESKGIFLDDESSGYHLSTWLSVLRTPGIGVVAKN